MFGELSHHPGAPEGSSVRRRGRPARRNPGREGSV